MLQLITTRTDQAIRSNTHIVCIQRTPNFICSPIFDANVEIPYRIAQKYYAEYVISRN